MFFLVVCLFALRLTAAIPFTECDVDGVQPPFVPKTVKLVPKTPSPGGTANFTIIGENSKPCCPVCDMKIVCLAIGTTSGEFITDVFSVFHFLGKTTQVPLQKESMDLCEHTQCPVEPGRMVLTYNRKMPIITPPGEYMVKVIAKDGDGKALMCVQVTFHVVRHSMLTT